MKVGLLDTPVLYLSRYINRNKADYYRILQTVCTQQTWEEWILYILEGIIQTSTQTIRIIRGINKLMYSYKHIIREKSPRSYSHELLNTIFSFPYTKISFIEQALGVSRITATNRLNELAYMLLILSK